MLGSVGGESPARPNSIRPSGSEGATHPSDTRVVQREGFIMSHQIPEPNDSLSLLNDWLRHQRTLYRQHLNNLFQLQIQAARYGANVPVSLQNEIGVIKEELKELEEGITQREHEIKTRIEGEEGEKQTREREKDLFKRFWQIRPDEFLFCIISTVESQDTGKYKRRATGLGEIRGYASIVYSLARAYERSMMKEDKLYFGDTFPDDKRREGSLILLGGDDKNEVTGQILKSFEFQGKKLPFRFYYEKDSQGKETGLKCLFVQDVEGKEEIPFIPRYEKVKRVNGDSKDSFVRGLWAKVLSFFGKTPEKAQMQVVQDFGVVARLPNPRNPHSKLYIMAGCHTYGTAAAAKAVAAKAILRRVEKTCPYYLTKKFFLAVVRCHMTSENFFHIDRMEIFYPLHEVTLRPISEGTVRGVDFTAPENAG